MFTTSSPLRERRVHPQEAINHQVRKVLLNKTGVLIVLSISIFPFPSWNHALHVVSYGLSCWFWLRTAWRHHGMWCQGAARRCPRIGLKMGTQKAQPRCRGLTLHDSSEFLNFLCFVLFCRILFLVHVFILFCCF